MTGTVTLDAGRCHPHTRQTKYDLDWASDQLAVMGRNNVSVSVGRGWGGTGVDYRAERQDQNIEKGSH